MKNMAKYKIWDVGKNYLIRTVTMIYTGRLVEVAEHELVLQDAAWIPETERWAKSVKEGVFKEVEPYHDGKVIIGRAAILDACVVSWKLPREQK
jgi:ribosomal protein S19E (S16A)